MDKMKIAVTGAAGRMGRELIRAIHAMEGCVVGGAIEQEGSLALGQDAGLLAGLGKLGVIITDDALESFARVDAVLDFTVPAASVEFAGLAANARIGATPGRRSRRDGARLRRFHGARSTESAGAREPRARPSR